MSIINFIGSGARSDFGVVDSRFASPGTAVFMRICFSLKVYLREIRE